MTTILNLLRSLSVEGVKATLSNTESLLRHAKPVLFELSLFAFFLIEVYRFFAGVLGEG